MRLHGGVGNFVRDETAFGNVIGFTKSFLRITEHVVIIFLDVM